MDSAAIHQRLASGRPYGWVLEPQAKEICRLAGLAVPEFMVAQQVADCGAIAAALGYPLAAKVVSPDIVHKTEHQGVAININDLAGLEAVFAAFARLPGFQGVLLERMQSGVELILGAKNDLQFGPVVLLGIGGTGVEIYQDTVIGMAPLTSKDVERMIAALKGRRLLEGYRNAPVADRDALIETVGQFSRLCMELAGHFASMDINPLFCSPQGCFVADARIMLP